VKESLKFELAHLKKKKKEEKHLACLATFWFVIDYRQTPIIGQSDIYYR